jgi:hypothetical protein
MDFFFAAGPNPKIAPTAPARVWGVNKLTTIMAATAETVSGK